MSAGSTPRAASAFTRRTMLKAGALTVGFALAGLQTHAEGAAPAPRMLDPNELDSFLAVVGDGTVTLFCGKVDLGQNHIDMIVKPTISGGIGSTLGKLVSTVKVTGSIDSPDIGVDAASAATAVVGLATGIASSGAGGLFGALSGALGGKQQQPQQQAAAKPAGDICAAARAMARR